MIKAIARLLQNNLEFIRTHPLICLLMSAAVLAASAGALYLLFVNLPPWLVLPCFSGGCQ